MTSFCMGGRSIESERLNGCIDKIWIIDISIVSLLTIFVCVVDFILNVFFFKDFKGGGWLELALYFCDANFIG